MTRQRNPTNKLLDRQIHELLTRCDGRGLAECEGALRVAAATLSRAAEITATTVVCEIADDDFDPVESLVGNIAHQYGLEADIRQQFGCCSVRFSRAQPSDPLASVAFDKSLLARILRR